MCSRTDAQLALLEGLGIPTQSVCNMAALAPNFVVRTSAEVEGVVTYLQENGITGARARASACARAALPPAVPGRALSVAHGASCAFGQR